MGVLNKKAYIFVITLHKKKGFRMTGNPYIYCKHLMGIEPTYPAWEAGVLPMNYRQGMALIMVCLVLLSLVYICPKCRIYRQN